MDFSKDYLEKLAEISTPKQRETHETFALYLESQKRFDFCRLRKFAKDLLYNPNNKEAKEGLSKLIEKLEIDIE
jgi:hypothetical protein